MDLQNDTIDQACTENPTRTDQTFKDAKGNTVNLGADFCYTREMCINKNLADQVMATDKTHAANDGRYLDIVTNTNLETLNITNLSIGIMVMIGLAVSYA